MKITNIIVGVIWAGGMSALMIASIVGYEMTVGFDFKLTGNKQAELNQNKEIGFTLVDASAVCVNKLRERVPKNLLSFHLDDLSTWIDVDSNLFRIFFHVFVGENDSSGTRGGGYRGRFSCQISTMTNQIKSSGMGDIRYGQ